jgi:hypothetical protein
MPTLYAALTYSGQLNQTYDRLVQPPVPASTFLQTLNFLGRADLYEGVNLLLSMTGANYLDIDQRASTSFTGNATLSLTPNPWVSLTSGFTGTVGWSSGGYLPDTVSQTEQLTGTLILTPIPALSASATGTWLIVGQRPSVYATFQVNYSPLRGDLQFGFAYNRTLDTASDAITQYLSPTVRWTIRPGVFLNVIYNLTQTSGPIVATSSSVFTTNLIITL